MGFVVHDSFESGRISQRPGRGQVCKAPRDNDRFNRRTLPCERGPRPGIPPDRRVTRRSDHSGLGFRVPPIS